MSGLAFAPIFDLEDRDDVTTWHAPQSREWCKKRGLPMPTLYDNRKPPTSRAADITRSLANQKPPLHEVAFFGFGCSRSIQAGYHVDDVPLLARLLVAATTEASVVEIHAVDPIVDTSGLCADDGFAAQLAKQMRTSGRWTGRVVAYACCPEGEIAREFGGEGRGRWL